MADQWLLDRIQQQKAGKAANPVVPTQQPIQQPVQQSPVASVSKMSTETNATPQGKLFSGNFIQKAFDIPSLVRYGYSGFLEGAYKKKAEQMRTPGYKGSSLASPSDVIDRFKAGFQNIPQAVQNRKSINREQGNVNVAKELGIENPVAQTAYNFGLEMAIPDLPVGKIAKATGITNLATKVGTKITNAARDIQPVAKAVEVFNPYFRNPEVGKLVKAAEERTQARLNKLYQTVSTLTKDLTPAQQARVGQVLEGGITTNTKLDDVAREIREISDEVGKQAVQLGLLKPETYEQFKGKYMTHIWNELVDKGQDSELFSRKVIPQVSGQFFQKRKGAEGYVRQFGPATFKGIGTEIKDIEAGTLFKQIAEKFAIDPMAADKLANPENYRYINKSLLSKYKNLDQFKGKILPIEVADYLEKTVQQGKKSFSMKMYDSATNAWKKGKTIYNPAYHVRNKMSNQILADMSTGEGLPGTILGDIESGRELAGKGNQMFVEAARKIGLVGRKSFGEMYDETLDVAGLQKTGKNVLKKADEALTGFQTKQEEAAKLNVFKSWLNKYAQEAKKTVEEAVKDPELLRKAKAKAEEAIFSPYNINKTERRAIGKIVPFYSFVRQAVPFTAKTFANNPERLTKYDKFKRAVEGLSPEGADQNKDLPEYAQGTIRLPIKNKEGNYYRVDPQYILPYGQIGPGDVERGQLPFGMGINPFISEAGQQVFNKDLYFGNEIRTSNQPAKAAKQTVEHAARSLLPTLYTTIGYPATNVLPGGDVPASSGKLYGAATGQKDYAGRTRSMPSAVLDALGVKNSAMDIKQQKQFNQIEKNKQRKAILQEINSIRRNQAYSVEEKKRQIKELQDQLKQL